MLHKTEFILVLLFINYHSVLFVIRTTVDLLLLHPVCVCSSASEEYVPVKVLKEF